MNALIAGPRKLTWFVFGGSITAIGIALMAQYGAGLEPCNLCIWQRWPHVIAAASALVALGTRRPLVRVALLTTATLGLTVGFGIAAYQIGLQQDLWATSLCVADPAGSLSSDDLGQALAGASSSGCAEVVTRVLGLSIPEWNAVASAALATMAGVGAWAAWRSGNAKET